MQSRIDILKDTAQISWRWLMHEWGQKVLSDMLQPPLLVAQQLHGACLPGKAAHTIFCICMLSRTHHVHSLQGAEEFRRAKRGREVASQPVPAAKRTRGIAFGSGAGDEDDAYGMTEDYVTAGTGKEGMSFEIASDDDDEPVPRYNIVACMQWRGMPISCAARQALMRRVR